MSTLEPRGERIRGRLENGIEGAAIDTALLRNRGYAGIYYAVPRLL